MIDARADDTRLKRAWAWAGWLWLVCVLLVAVQQAMFWRAPKIDSDVMALLPLEQRDPLLALAEQRIADDATRQVVVLLNGGDWTDTQRAARAFADSLREQPGLKAVRNDAAESAIDFYRPYRDRLLTPTQQTTLQRADTNALADQALAALFGPAGGGATEWRADPLGLWPQWWQARAGQGISERDGLISVSRDGEDWALLRFEAASAFRLDGQAHLQSALDCAAAQAKALAPALQVLQAGVPLHAEAAAVRASWEMNTIGFGSLLAVVLLMWLAFRSPRPVLLVSASLLIGCAAGVAATVWIFGSIHLLTLVFGASLVGVAEDYGIHYFSSRQGNSDTSAMRLMRQLLPGLLLAWITSALAYLALGAAPLPGLRQMAVFSTAGLAAAFATVACWFPWFDNGPRPISRFGQAIAGSLAAWPRLHGRVTAVAVISLALLSSVGLSRLQARDDLRSLQSSPPALIAQQKQVGRLLGLASPAQFYLVRGDSAEQVLQSEEALKAQLDTLVGSGEIAGYEAVSDWVPSQARQEANARLSARVETQVLARIATAVGQDVARPEFAPNALRVDAWLQQPVSQPLRARWLGETAQGWASVVTLKGLGADTNLAALQSLADKTPGVRWVNRTADISEHLGHYRYMMALLWLGGLVAVAVALYMRFRREAWRALLPTVLATALTLAALAWLGEPLQLFTVLAMLLLLGMGVDYGIFLLEHRGDGASWLAVSLGAASTLLAFGLLTLSATPALHSFGLSLLFGIGLVWLLSPLFRPGPALSPAAFELDPSALQRD